MGHSHADALMPSEGLNFLSEATPGCYVCHSSADPSWIIDVGEFDLEDFGVGSVEELPDISVDPETHMLTVINTAAQAQIYYITLGHQLRDGQQQLLKMGTARDEDGHESACTTLILEVSRLTTSIRICLYS